MKEKGLGPRPTKLLAQQKRRVGNCGTNLNIHPPGRVLLRHAASANTTCQRHQPQYKLLPPSDRTK